MVVYNDKEEGNLTNQKGRNMRELLATIRNSDERISVRYKMAMDLYSVLRKAAILSDDMGEGNGIWYNNIADDVRRWMNEHFYEYIKSAK